jgi:hypothetical protein
MERKEFLDDLIWGRQHHTELLERYRDEWVAIHNKRIIASGKDLGEVEEEAKTKTGREKVPVFYVESGSHIYEG